MEESVDPEFYLCAYPDVKSSGMDAKFHYLKYGKKEKRIPNIQHFNVLYPKFDINKFISVYNHILKEDHQVETLSPEVLYRIIIYYHDNVINRCINEINIQNINNALSNNNKYALCIHIGNKDIFLDMIKIIQKILKEIPYHLLDIYISIVDTIKLTEKEITSLIGSAHNINILFVENVGMDIGGFFRCLQLMQKNNKTYDVLMKIHTKTDKRWRDELLKIFSDPVCYLNLFNINPQIGVITNNKYIFPLEGIYLYGNHYHINNLKKKYLINNFNNITFPAGTIFYIRMNILKPLFEYGFDKIISELNYSIGNRATFDPSWYVWANPDVNLTPETGLQHYNNNFSERSPNLLHKMQHMNNKSIECRDGMIEHAYERFIGYLCLNYNMYIYGSYF
jgi:lipopolysaccharide biosynthesis protein